MLPGALPHPVGGAKGRWSSGSQRWLSSPPAQLSRPTGGYQRATPLQICTGACPLAARCSNCRRRECPGHGGSGSDRVRTACVRACVRGPEEVLMQGRLLHRGAEMSGGSSSPRRVTCACAPSAVPASHSPCPSVSGSCPPASEEWPRAGRAWGLKRIRRLAFCLSQGFASFSGLQTSTYRM